MKKSGDHGTPAVVRQRASRIPYGRSEIGMRTRLDPIDFVEGYE